MSALADQAEERLGKRLAARKIGVVVEGKRITLTGSVQSFYEKQLAQEAVRSLGLDIENQLIVTNGGIYADSHALQKGRRGRYPT